MNTPRDETALYAFAQTMIEAGHSVKIFRDRRKKLCAEVRVLVSTDHFQARNRTPLPAILRGENRRS